MSSKNIYGEPLANSTGGEYDSYHRHYVHGLPNSKAADDCTDQLPMFSAVGRGIAGDSYRVVIKSDSDNATYLAGESYDAATKEWSEDWNSENINGGHLELTYNEYTDTIPTGFTITFTYTRPERIEWEWTTPLIPFIAMTEEEARYYYAQGLSKILSVPVENLVWLLEHEEETSYEGTGMTEEGIEGTGKDLVHWIYEYAIENWFDMNQDTFVNKILHEIQKNQQKTTYMSPSYPIPNDKGGTTDTTIDWVALYDNLICQNMIKVYSTGFVMTAGDGNEVDLCAYIDPDTGEEIYGYAPAEMIPAYGNLDIPVAHAVSQTGLPMTISIICQGLSEDGKNIFNNEKGHDDSNFNENEIAKCRFLLKARVDEDIEDSSETTKPFHLSNSIIYYNSYNKTQQLAQPSYIS